MGRFSSKSRVKSIDLDKNRRIYLVTHLCEMKFSEAPYTIKSDYEKRLRERRELFMEVTGISRGVILTMITPRGLKPGAHSTYIHSEITSKHLFADLEG